MILIGFDFSINKPAATVLMDGKLKFFIWPIKLSGPEEKIYARTEVRVLNRHLDEVSKKSNLNTSQMTLEHTKRSIDLAEIIVSDLKEYIKNHEDQEIYVASEGLSFASKGNSNLDLATYKGVLLSYIYKEISKNIYTYAPITIKKVAGRSKKKEFEDKNPMIKAFSEEPFEDVLKTMIKNGETIAKVNHIKCIDDIADSYFCCKTLYKKEKLQGFPLWD